MIKLISILGVTIGFVIGTLGVILDKSHVNWPVYLLGWGLGIIGVMAIRIKTKKEATSQDVLSQNIEQLEASLKTIVSNLAHLNESKHHIFTYDIRHKIDDLFPSHIEIFVEARQSITHTFGMGAYGEIMSSFAAGERYLNRVWSASAEGYIDEVNIYLEKALYQFDQSLKLLRSYQTKS